MTTRVPGQRPLAPGSKLGRYRMLDRIAAGGMAEVYLARPEGLDGLARPVALKLILPHLASDPKFVRLFEQEARIALRVGHPNIAHVLELQRDGGELFLVMEYVAGHTLLSLLTASDEPMPLPCALSILVQTCAAIHHAHEATYPDGTPLHLVHRDISPSNVMLRHDGVVKVVDFGIAKALAETGMTRTGSLKGKAGYMSPEQCRGAPLTRVSDVFNLGILLYETTTGRRAFRGPNLFAVMNTIVDGRYQRPSRVLDDYPPQLEAIVARALSLTPEERPATALELQRELEAFAVTRGMVLSEHPVAEWIAATMGPAQPLALWVEDHAPAPSRSIPGWAKAVGVGGVAGAAVFFAIAGTATRPDPPATADASGEPEADVRAEAEPVPEAGPEAEPEPEPEPEPKPKPVTEPPAARPEAEVRASPAPRAERTRSKRPKRPKRPTQKPKTLEPSGPLFPWESK